MRYDFVADVSQPNAVLRIRDIGHWSAGVWTLDVTSSVRDARLQCLEFVARTLLNRHKDWQLWLVCGHSVFQPDNRITRHNGLWTSLRKGGVAVPMGELTAESLQESREGIRAFGAVRVGMDQLAPAHHTMLASQAAIISGVAASVREWAHALVEQKWNLDNTQPPSEILELVCSANGVVIDVYGGFDDPEVYAALFGRREVARTVESTGV